MCFVLSFSNLLITFYNEVIVDSLIFVFDTNFHGFHGYRRTSNLNVQQNTSFLKECMQTLSKPRNKISMNMQAFHNPGKLVPTKINESTGFFIKIVKTVKISLPTYYALHGYQLIWSGSEPVLNWVKSV